jgi:hypothetical protein
MDLIWCKQCERIWLMLPYYYLATDKGVGDAVQNMDLGSQL